MFLWPILNFKLFFLLFFLQYFTPSLDKKICYSLIIPDKYSWYDLYCSLKSENHITIWYGFKIYKSTKHSIITHISLAGQENQSHLPYNEHVQHWCHWEMFNCWMLGSSYWSWSNSNCIEKRNWPKWDISPLHY